MFLFCLLERKKLHIRKSEAVLSSCQSHDTQDVIFQSVMIHSEHLSTSDPFLAVECEEAHKVTFKTKGGKGYNRQGRRFDDDFKIYDFINKIVG